MYVSAASVWEASIKRSLGRLAIEDADLVAEIGANGFLQLPVSARHGAEAGALPPVHRDPFDRMLVAQARIEQLRLATVDKTLSGYDVDLLPS